MKIKQAIIPAAGLGTRFLPITKTFPKELIPLAEKPCIQYIIDEAILSGVEEFIFIISREKEIIKSYFSKDEQLEKWLSLRNKQKELELITKVSSQAKFTYVYQEKPLGLGHAVSCAKEIIKDDYFFVLLPDDIIQSEIPACSQMLEVFQKHEKSIVAVQEVPWKEVSRYGVVQASPLSENVGRVDGIIEKPSREMAPSNLAVIGRYLLSKDIFSHLENTKTGVGGEIQITDALATLAKNDELCCYSYNGTRHDTGNPLGLLMANIGIGLKHPEYQGEVLKYIQSLL